MRNDQVSFKALENSQIEKIRSTNQKRKTANTFNSTNSYKSFKIKDIEG